MVFDYMLEITMNIFILIKLGLTIVTLLNQ